MPDPGHFFSVRGKSDEELRATAKQAGLALRIDELKRIAQELGRDPTIVEAYAFDAQWSEHCSYKSSRHHLKKLPTSGPSVVLGVGQDAGIVHLGEHEGERYGVVVAHESHNHPSQVVPYEGAATGVGGIVRDVLCMGAEVVAVADALRFGRVEDADSHQRYVATSVVDGIAGYGNAIGVPNITGDVYFDEGFDDNCLVNVVALGIVKESEIIHSKAPAGSDGWDIVLVGKATDASGFGGASFSSLTLDEEDAEANKGAVQVPDPFLKNVIMRASYRVFEYLRANKITAGFKDLGAGGIMGCTAEICSSGGYGAIIDLDDVSTAQEDLPPPVIAIGETQERLTWILPGHVTPEVLRIYNEEFSLPQIAKGACAVVIGCVQKEKRYVMRSGDEIVMDVDIDFLTGSIKDELPFDAYVASPQPEAKADGRNARAEHVLEHRDVCSREPLYKQYDNVVRGATVVQRNRGDAGVMIVPGTPLAFAASVAGNPRYGRIDARYAGVAAVTEAIRKVVSVGAEPVGLTDCLNFGNPQNRVHLSELVASINGLAEAAAAMKVPFVSGNVSLYNESKRGSAIPASPIVACIGAIQNVARAVSRPFKLHGSALYLCAMPGLWERPSLGGSAVADAYAFEGSLPPIDYASLAAANARLLNAMRSGLVRSCAAVYDGGVLAALVRMTRDAHKRGETIGADLDSVPSWALFSEEAWYVIEAAPGFEGIVKGSDVFRHIGATTARAEIRAGEELLDLNSLHDAWSKPLAEAYG